MLYALIQSITLNRKSWVEHYSGHKSNLLKAKFQSLTKAYWANRLQMRWENIRNEPEWAVISVVTTHARRTSFGQLPPTCCAVCRWGAARVPKLQTCKRCISLHQKPMEYQGGVQAGPTFSHSITSHFNLFYNQAIF